MMSILEYADDVNISIARAMKMCDALNIVYTDEDSMLTEEQIISLDYELDNTLEEEIEDKVEQIITDRKIDVENTTKTEKLKSKVEKVENSKISYKDNKKEMYKNKEKLQNNATKKDDNIVLYNEDMTVAELANLLGVSSTEIIKKLMKLGVMATINYALAYDVVEVLILDYGMELKRAETQDISNFEEYEIVDEEKNLEKRASIVTVMGHVDHGKTSLLDKIRQTDVVSGEAGGITQGIGAYQVKYKDNKITFIDTPGHEAFTEMRARGAQVTDIVIIIVAADDGVKPQTKEAIDHAKAAGVPIIVAINKVDKPEANIERVMTELMEYGVSPEEWGGDTIFNKISCKTGEGIDSLLENILLISEMGEYKANPKRYAIGTVIESKKDQKTGVVCSLLVQNGTLRLGDPIVVGNSFGRVRTLRDSKGKDVTEAYPSMPVEVTGLTEVPKAGEKFMAFESEKQAKTISLTRKERSREKDVNKSGMTLEQLFGAIKEGLKEINIVLKVDVNGSLEAIKSSLNNIDVDGVKLNIIRAAVGNITESDVVLAHTSKALILGFNVEPSSNVHDTAKEYNVEIKIYNVIYSMIEDLEKLMKGILDPVFEKTKVGEVEIRQIFKFSKIGLIAGSFVKDGLVKKGMIARVLRNGEEIVETKIKTLQREKDQVKEVTKGMECGITLEDFQDIKERDIIEIYELKEVKN